VTDFKFTDLERKSASVRFMTPNAQTLFEALTSEGSSLAATDPESVFKVKLREDDQGTSMKVSSSAPVKQSETITT
jgi:hypothetical protein